MVSYRILRILSAPLKPEQGPVCDSPPVLL